MLTVSKAVISLHKLPLEQRKILTLIVISKALHYSIVVGEWGMIKPIRSLQDIILEGKKTLIIRLLLRPAIYLLIFKWEFIPSGFTTVLPSPYNHSPAHWKVSEEHVLLPHITG